MSALARIARGGPGSPRSEEEGRGGERPPKKAKCCPTCAGNLCGCPPEAPLADKDVDGGVIPAWRAAERWVPAYRRDLIWPVAPIPQRPLFTAAGGGTPGLIRVPPPAQPPAGAGGRVIPTAVVNTMADGGVWGPVDVPQRMLLPPQDVVDAGTPGPSRMRELPLFEAPARTPSIESVCSSTGCHNLDDADSAGDSGPYLDLDLKL